MNSDKAKKILRKAFVSYIADHGRSHGDTVSVDALFIAEAGQTSFI